MEVNKLSEEPSSSSSHSPSDSSQELVDSAYGSECSHYSRAEYETGRHIVTKLQNEKLWKSFSKLGNEMIVTKPGRRLFPALLLNIQGLNPDKEYSISLRFVSADNQRYRYVNMHWMATGESEVVQNEAMQILPHPNSPNTGLFWMKRPISFKSVKITHFAKSRNGNILLHTMHKYFMELVVTPVDHSQTMYIPLEDTSFIAVSAYQNMELTQLKIDHNPFAKGFRYKKAPSSNGVHSSQNGQQERGVMPYWQNVSFPASQFIPPTQPLPPFLPTCGGTPATSSSNMVGSTTNPTSLPVPTGCCTANMPLPTSPSSFSAATPPTNYPLGNGLLTCSASSSVCPTPKFAPLIRPSSLHFPPHNSSVSTSGLPHLYPTLYPPFTHPFQPEQLPMPVPSPVITREGLRINGTENHTHNRIN